MKEEDLKKRLTEEQYRVLRRKETEKRGSGKWLFNKETGVYVCAACGQQLFKSNSKFDSESGWPSFYEVIDGNVELKVDHDWGYKRVEVICSKCHSHLGHLFSDAPQTPTGKRYCINSLALDFKKIKDSSNNLSKD
jgi:peptide-methionine (R)-S-oxide reductase